MAVKIAVMCHKGGVAKTSTVQTIAYELSQKKNTKILICDLDQQNNHKTLMGVRDKDDKGMSAVLLNSYNPKKMVHSIRENIDLITSGGRHISKFDEFSKTHQDPELLLRERMKEVENDYDYIIIDTPPAMGLISGATIVYADYVVIPCDMDTMGFAAAKNMIDFFGTFEKQTDENIAKILGVLPIKADLRRNLDNLILDQLYVQDDNNMLRGAWVLSPIRQSSNIKTAQARKKFVQEVLPGKPFSEDYAKVTSEILSFIDEDQHKANPIVHSNVEVELSEGRA
jgi:chromosome partitioning protein